MAARSRRPRGLSANHINEEERLQTILNDKSALSCIRLLGKENWVKVEERPNCFYCARKFRPFSIKRHCRSCGEIVCSNCYRRRRVSVTPTLEVTVRLCFDCIDKAMLQAESEHLRSSVAARGKPRYAIETNSTEVATKQCISDGKKTCRDSSQTACTTSTSICSRFSDFSGSDNWSDVNSDVSDSCSLAGSDGSLSGSQRDSRRGQPVIPATSLIEFLPEEKQSKIYDAHRHEILTRFNVLDSQPEKEYDALCELVRQVFECNVAAVAFMDQTRQWYKTRYGITQTALPREIAFCSQLLQTPLPTIVMDATKDPRFSQNPLVTGSANIRFYATAPICDPSTGIVIGSVFVMDPELKEKLPSRAMEVLSYVSSAAEKLLQDRAAAPVLPTLKHRRHLSVGRRTRQESLPPFREIRASSLQSVPEEIEAGDFCTTQSRSNASSISSNSSTWSSQSGSMRSSELKPLVSSQQQHHQPLNPNTRWTSSALTDACNTSSSKLSLTDLVSSIPKSFPPTPRKILDSSCIELFHRIASTQQLLAKQHDTLLAMLTQPSLRSSSIGHTADESAGILAVQRARSLPHNVDSVDRRPVDL
uniref:FYVE-type domain-containing protein n=1 Tax=Hyaloperonospora arabidopsidis (strain Emoy2) TaxID=559515 RepID=M4C2Q2_HYAAE